jgi:hypothetical protein
VRGKVRFYDTDTLEESRSLPLRPIRDGLFTTGQGFGGNGRTNDHTRRCLSMGERLLRSNGSISTPRHVGRASAGWCIV